MVINDKRDALGDITKAIGIIFIVIGHCWSVAAPYVYTCHLAIFFLILGYNYNNIKYSNQPFDLFGNRLKGMLPKYIFYLFLFIILHNYFINIGIYSENVMRYPSLASIFNAMLGAVFFNTFEFMAGAMWFIPMLLIGTAIFGSVFYLSKKFSSNKIKRYNWILTLLFIIIGIIGLYTNSAKVELL